MNFWSLSTMTLLMWASMKPSNSIMISNPTCGMLTTESFSQVEIPEKTVEIQVFEIELESCMVAMATYMRSDWWNWSFLDGSHEAKTWNSKAFWRHSVIFGKGAKCVWGPMCPTCQDRVKVVLAPKKRKGECWAWSFAKHFCTARQPRSFPASYSNTTNLWKSNINHNDNVSWKYVNHIHTFHVQLKESGDILKLYSWKWKW